MHRALAADPYHPCVAHSVIREAVESDLWTVQHLNSSSFVNDAVHDSRLDDSWPYSRVGADYFRTRIRDVDGVCLLAEREGAPVGYVTGGLCASETYRRVQRRAELETMYVINSARRAGVGSALFENFRAWATANGCDELLVSAYSGNQRAIAFYKAQGFQPYSHSLVMPVGTSS